MEANLTLARYDYLAQVLEDDFPQAYFGFNRSGILPYELHNLCAECAALLDDFGFEALEDSRLLRFAVISAVDDYLQEGVEDGV